MGKKRQYYREPDMEDMIPGIEGLKKTNRELKAKFQENVNAYQTIIHSYLRGITPSEQISSRYKAARKQLAYNKRRREEIRRCEQRIDEIHMKIDDLQSFCDEIYKEAEQQRAERAQPLPASEKSNENKDIYGAGTSKQNMNK